MGDMRLHKTATGLGVTKIAAPSLQGKFFPDCNLTADVNVGIRTVSVGSTLYNDYAGNC